VLVRRLKYYGYRVAPRLAAALHGRLRRWAARRRDGRGVPSARPAPFGALDQARALRQASEDRTALDDLVDLVFRYPGVAPNQNRGEILGLVRRVRELRPTRVCEIGSALGGTLFLLSRAADPSAALLSIDPDNRPERREVFRLLVGEAQELTCLEADSHAQATLDRCVSWIGTGRLDFLFIDGDHALDGVRRDWEMYGPLVRSGGLVAFHDIVPDFLARYGVETGTRTGGVPEFWARLKERHPGAVEIVDHRLQDGRGIGLIEIG
jgi:predicted O-methyltransferase YrrM